jgi:hypothetical protein
VTVGPGFASLARPGFRSSGFDQSVEIQAQEAADFTPSAADDAKNEEFWLKTVTGRYPAGRTTRIPLNRSTFRALIDGKSSIPHHNGQMRRLWLTLLLAFSLAFGGVASAWAAQDCPYNKAAAGMHACCPDGQMQQKSNSGHPAKKAADCTVGQACRAAIAVAPTLPTLKVAAISPADPVIGMSDAGHRLPPSFSFWRPPRAV